MYFGTYKGYGMRGKDRVSGTISRIGGAWLVCKPQSLGHGYIGVEEPFASALSLGNECYHSKWHPEKRESISS
jgi:hypothetical protein